MVCYHSTKILDKNIILSDGLGTNEWDTYSKNIIKTLRILEVAEKDIVQVHEAIKRTYDWKYFFEWKGTTVIFYSDTDLLSEDMGAKYEQFCENIGDELARQALKKAYPQLYRYLRENGEAFLVKFRIPFTNIKDYLKYSIIYQFVAYFAGSNFGNYNYEIYFDGDTDKAIMPSDILELIPYGTDRYYFNE